MLFMLIHYNTKVCFGLLLKIFEMRLVYFRYIAKGLFDFTPNLLAAARKFWMMGQKGHFGAHVGSARECSGYKTFACKISLMKQILYVTLGRLHCTN